MPGMLTHVLCGERVISSLEGSPLFPILQQYRQAFNLGTQGPDIFFFHRVWPWTKSHGINKTGNHMHENGVNAFFSNAMEYISRKPVKEQDLLTAYLCGFACHHALDLTAHPYIYYRSGFHMKGEVQVKRKTYYHSEFETNLDFLMLQREKGITPLQIKPYAFIRVSMEQTQEISQMLSAVLLDTYGLSISPQQVTIAIEDMQDTYAVLRDRTGLKRNMLSFLGVFISPAGLAASMIYPKKVRLRMDFLNMEHRPWSLPWDNSVRRTDSFVDLFEEGAREGKELVTAIHSCLAGQRNVEETLGRIGNRSFSSGLNCEIPLTFRHQDSIFEV